MYDDEFNWRYWVNADGEILRGRPYRLGDLYGDLWRNYWDGDFTTAFTIYWRGAAGPDLTMLAEQETGDADRAMQTWRLAREYDQDVDAALTRLARRLTGNYSSRFVGVSPEYDLDMYALSWDGDPDHTWRDEIEAVNGGDVYRMEVERYDSFLADWSPADDMCDEWYGVDNARAAHEREFDLTEFPAELLIEQRGA